VVHIYAVINACESAQIEGFVNYYRQNNYIAIYSYLTRSLQENFTTSNVVYVTQRRNTAIRDSVSGR
jgi:hypothetical protein